MLIDFHVHLFPDALAARTLPLLSRTANDAPYYTSGTVRDTLEKMDQWGVDAAVLQHIATSAHAMRKVNDFAASVQSERLYGFGSVHPDAPDALEELERIKALGLYGVKFHPEYQSFYVDDDKMAPIYEKLTALKLPVLFHAGWDPLSPDLVHCDPARLAQVVDAYPDLTVIAAHLGGLCRYDDVERYLLAKPNLYLDTAMTAPYLRDEAQVERIIRIHGTKHVLFATDCPWSTPAAELALLRKTALSQAELDDICGGNALRLLQSVRHMSNPEGK